MKPQAIIDDLCAALDGVVPKSTWGETAIFNNPGRALPIWVYFCTFKERDGENDRASALTNEGVFRVSMGISPETYVQRFGPRPAWPAKEGVATTGHDFAALDVLTPHPVYAWMGWARTTSPTALSYAEIRPLIEEAHRLAVARFDGRQRRSARSAAT
jgi:hypothetical protein